MFYKFLIFVPKTIQINQKVVLKIFPVIKLN